MSRIEKARELRKKIEASTAVARKYVLASEITEEEMNNIKEIYPRWEDFEGKKIPKSEIIRYNNELYKVIKGINWQDDWRPDLVPSDFDKITPPTNGEGEEIVAEWEQRYGHNPYQVGDKVLWQGKVYQCKLPNTTHSPTDYAAAWELIEG